VFDSGQATYPTQNPGSGRFQPTACSHRRDPQRQSGCIVGLDRDAPLLCSGRPASPFAEGFEIALFEVTERQWRPCLERLDRNVAAYFAHNWQIEELADQKALVVTQIRYDDFEEVVRLTGDEVACNNLRHRYDGLLERHCALVGVPVDLDAYEDREAETNAVAPQGRAITFNVPIPLQALDATQTGRWRQADFVRKFDVAQPSVGLQLGDDAAVNGIKIGFWHSDVS